MTSMEFYREFGNIDLSMIDAAAPAERPQSAGGGAPRTRRCLWAVFTAPVLSLACMLLLWFTGSGGILLPIWLFWLLGIPIVHFFILRSGIRNNRINKKRTLLLAAAVLFLAIALDSYILGFLPVKGRAALLHTVFRLIWAAVCGLLILGHTAAERFCRNSIRCKLAMAAGGLLALCFNAFLTYLTAPTLAARYAIDGVELVLMPVSVIVLSVYSHLLGRIMTRRFMPFKLAGWLLGILSSEFVTIWLLGTPRTLPTEHAITTGIWLFVSGFVFLCCLIGVLTADPKGKGDSRS